ncbi:MAG: C45 family autoproteolytic acyltransferase/hydrolase, partial [Armatimonadota bacterium]|nr:C45 family autoproteolytic acyltransferase/hydrolase [Armatimonadota bacterium]
MPLQLVELAGEPRDMGRQFGEELRDGVRALSEERLRLAMAHAARSGRRLTREECLALAGQFVSPHRTYAPEVWAELEGIAEGAAIPLELLLIGNGYTDYRDVLRRVAGEEECSSFLIHPDAADGKPLCGQTWDMHATAEPYAVVVRRRPRKGPPTLSLTTAGCLSLV